MVLVAAALAPSAYADKPPSNPGNASNSGASGPTGNHGQSGSNANAGNNGNGNGSNGTSNAGGQSKPTDPGNSASGGIPGSQQSALPRPGATLATKAKLYGRYCQNQSKLHVAGQQGTLFSRCVTAMAKLATHRAKDPWAACSGLSRRPVPGATGSPFSRCVVAGTRLLNDLRKP